MQDNNFHNLKRVLNDRHGEIKRNLVEKHWNAFQWASDNTKQIAAGALGSILLLANPNHAILAQENSQHQQFVEVPENLFLISDIKKYLPDQVGILLPAQEEKIAGILTSYFGFSVKSEINGMRLLNTYGYIGAEQHLMRYPGDTIESHFENGEYRAKYESSGMAPGRGGFGYFAKSRQDLTQEDIDREKYYIAVQTFLAPGFLENKREYIEFFKFRKMLIVNPNTGKAMVAVIGDAGPAVWTGKQLGGSPEVMKYLERVDGKAKGAVLYFFIEDPENKIPLGPISPIDANNIVENT